MAANPSAPAGSLIRTFASLGVVFVLLRSAQSVEFMSGVTKPLVVGALKLLGLRALDDGGQLLVAHVKVPWTGDCAGLNILAVLLALTFWMNRAEPFTWRLALKVAAAVPLAFVANLGRILTLIGYRLLFAPSVESAQLHYFIGFLWLLPFVGFFLPRAAAGAGVRWPGILQMAAALGLVAPLATGPGGTLVTICVLLALAQSRLSVPQQSFDYWLAAAWLAVAPLVAITRMESLWLPWLLGCPLLIARSRGWFVALPLVLLGTIPLVAAHGVLQWIVLVGVLWSVWNWLVLPAITPAEAPPPARVPAIGAGLLAVYLTFPFIATSVAGGRTEREAPPTGSMARLVEAGGYEVRFPGQSRDIAVVWYEPSGGGRHHTVEVCMNYRGVRLQPTTHAAVLTDGRNWMREFFFLGDDLIPDYRSYLRRTLLPFSAVGVHLIVVGSERAMTADQFAASTDVLAGRLQQLRTDGRSRVRVAQASGAR